MKTYQASIKPIYYYSVAVAPILGLSDIGEITTHSDSQRTNQRRNVKRMKKSLKYVS